MLDSWLVIILRRVYWVDLTHRNKGIPLLLMRLRKSWCLALCKLLLIPHVRLKNKSMPKPQVTLQQPSTSEWRHYDIWMACFGSFRGVYQRRKTSWGHNLCCDPAYSLSVAWAWIVLRRMQGINTTVIMWCQCFLTTPHL